jgi:hypothetical protein
LWSGGVAQVTEHLPSKCEALCSSPNTTTEERERERKREREREVFAIWLNKKIIVSTQPEKLKLNTGNFTMLRNWNLTILLFLFGGGGYQPILKVNPCI